MQDKKTEILNNCFDIESFINIGHSSIRMLECTVTQHSGSSVLLDSSSDGVLPDILSDSLCCNRLYIVDCRFNPEQPYPANFMDALRAWKAILRLEGIEGPAPRLVGFGFSGGIALSVALWSRDHGIPLPSSIHISNPYVGFSKESGILEAAGMSTTYYMEADTDDPCSFPIIGDYYGFPNVTIFSPKDNPLKADSDAIAYRMAEQGVSVSYMHE